MNKQDGTTPAELTLKERYEMAWYDHTQQLCRLAETSAQVDRIQAIRGELMEIARTNAKELYPVQAERQAMVLQTEGENVQLEDELVSHNERQAGA